jgi:uncharacterized protein (TIGR01777 family)
MKILVTGSSGLVGTALVPFLISKGYKVLRLVRSKPKSPKLEIQWNPEESTIDTARLEAEVCDAVIHLAGESVAALRWTDEKKRRIRESRVKGTQFLSETLSRLSNPPKVLVCASATGYYGNRGDEILTEESKPGSGFLAEVAQAWERATDPASKKGIRVVLTRFGVILSPVGGALGKMLPLFRLGLAGVIGDGQQYMSWVALDDVVGAIYHAMITENLKGPVNVVSPHPVTSREFTKTLGRILNRPTLLPLPTFAARIALGEMADETILSSTRVEPRKLLETGYKFQYSKLEEALRHLLK